MRSFVCWVAAAGFVVVGCSTSAPRDDVSRVASPIINGQNDTTHQAVVFLYAQQGNTGEACSGTIVKVDAAAKIGYVLTAAHCVATTPTVVLQGDDITSASALKYDVLDAVAHPSYDPANVSSSYDFGVVRIIGADASTPFIPMSTSPDGLFSGATVVSVGYGKTTTASGAPDNSTRHRITKTLGGLTTTQMNYSLSSGGICQGDSGGPVLFTSGGKESVAGVHSYVTGNCDGQGYSDRVISASAWLATALSKPAPAEDCTFCDKAANSGNGACAQMERTCLADTNCSKYYDCAVKCGGSSTCLDGCATQNPLGVGPFLAVTQCTCNVGCKAVCSGLTCSKVPKCGYAYAGGTCRSCMEASCCAQLSACAADGVCYDCLKENDAPSACATNDLRQALASCQSASCNDTCAGVDTSTAGDPDAGDGTDPASVGGGGGGTRTITKSGCGVATAGRGGAGSGLLLAAAAAMVAVRRRRRRRR